MSQQEFEKAAEQPSYAPFKLVLGKMLRDFGEISSEDYDLVGKVQAQTVVIAEVFDRGSPDQKTAILERFEGKNWKTGEKTGDIDLNSAVFKLEKDRAFDDLNSFLGSLNIEEIDTKIDSAIQAVHAEKGVHPKAAASGAILKALCLSDYDRGQTQAIIDASLIMQMSTRGLERVEKIENGEYDRQAAKDLMGLSNKVNYKFDPVPLVNANESLLQLCTDEMRIHTKLETIPDIDLLTLQRLYEPTIIDNTRTLVEAIPAAAELYRKAGKPALAERAEKTYKHFSEKYAEILAWPHIMGTPKQENGNDPKPGPEV